MIELTFSVDGDCRGRLISTAPQASLHNSVLALGSFLPGFSISDCKTPDFVLHHEETPTLRLTCDGMMYFMEAPWEEIKEDIPHVLLGIARLVWIKRNIYPVHAACVGTRKRGYTLLLGPNGSGKTSVALECTRRGLSILGGDKTLVRTFSGALETVGGTRTMTVRPQDITLWEEWTEKAEYVGGRYCFSVGDTAEKINRINNIVLLRVNNKALHAAPLTPLRALHECYPAFLSTQRADVIIGGKILLDGDLSISIRQRMMEELGTALKNVQSFEVTGGAQDIANFVLQQASS